MAEKSDYPRIDLCKELASYDVERKWNDYIGLQKSIIETLRNEGFFENNVVENMESGMLVRISIKKKVASNLFWIHHIDYMKKDFVLLDSSRGKELKERQNP